MTVRPHDDGPALSVTSSIRLGLLAERCYGRTTLEEGQSASSPCRGEVAPATTKTPSVTSPTTVEYWRNWLSAGTFPDHPWRPYLERSAPHLEGPELRTHGRDHGGVDDLAARDARAGRATGTTATPGLGTPPFMLRSLYRLGFNWEALEYFAFVLEAVAAEGDLDRPFSSPDHVRHRRGARPDRADAGPPLRLPRVAPSPGRQRRLGPAPKRRVGHAPRRGRHPPAPGPGQQIAAPAWAGLAGFVDAAIEHQDDPDQGIWEIRGDPQHFTASKVLCWVAVGPGGRPGHRAGRRRTGRTLAARPPMR